MVLYDSSKKRKVAFKPIKDSEVRIYVCGPTVYDDAHLGHARSAISFDLLRRVLKALGYKVVFVRNITDIDDKIIKKSLETKEPIEKITSKYTKRYLKDMSSLGVQEPDLAPKATESIDSIVDMIKKLLDRGYAYMDTESTVWFDTSKDKKYCSLSKRCLDEDEVISRIEHEAGKKDPKDFALWKACKKDDVCYESPFGRGRPGWHIECSAMIESYLAYKDSDFAIDIHGGGADLLFPHHENEAAQTRCATGKELAKYWMHNGFVNIDGKKMSKSLGNSFYIKDALKAYDGEILRFYLLSTHYRIDFNFNEEDLLSSKKRLDKLYRLKKRIYLSSPSKVDDDFKKELLNALKDDLNISVALSVIDDMIVSANEYLDANPKDKGYKKVVAANIEFIFITIGIGGKDAYDYFKLGISSQEIERIEELIRKRDKAKKRKDYKEADAIREELIKSGIMIMDTPSGTVWERVNYGI